MATKDGAIELAASNGFVFTNAAQDDLLIRTLDPTQSIMIGTVGPGCTSVLDISNSNLTVNGTIQAASVIGTTSRQDNCMISLWNNNTTLSPTATAYYGFGVNNNTFRYQVFNTTANHVFYADTAELMRITGGGSVGINTNNPQRRLHMLGDYMRIDAVESTDAGIEIMGSTFPSYRWAMYREGASSNLNFFRGGTGGGTFLSLAYGGNVGVGTTTPAYKLDVTGTINATGYNNLPVASTTVSGIVQLVNSTSNTSLTGAATAFAVNNLRLNTLSNATVSGTTLTVSRGDGTTFTFSGGGSTFAFSNATRTNNDLVLTKADNTTFTYTPSITNSAGTQIFGVTTDTAALPSFTFTGDTNTGMFHPATDVLGFSTNGAERLTIDSTGDVGIGFTNPLYKLDVAGITRVVQDGSSGGSVRVAPGVNGNEASIGFYTKQDLTSTNAGDMWVMGQGSYSVGKSNFGIGCSPNSTATMTLLASGFVGINKQVPTVTFDVNGTINATTYNNLNTQTYLVAMSNAAYATSNTLYTGTATNTIAVAASNRAFFALSNASIANNALNITKGDGTLVSYTPLFTGCNVGYTAVRFTRTINTSVSTLPTTVYTTTQQILAAADSATAPTYSYTGDATTGLFRPAAGAIGITTGGTERMRVNASGNIGIGTFSPSSLLHAYSSGPTFILQNFADNVNSVVRYMHLNGTTNTEIGTFNTSNLFIANKRTGNITFETSATERMRIDSTGNVGIGTTSPAYTLDVSGVVRSSAIRLDADNVYVSIDGAGLARCGLMKKSGMEGMIAFSDSTDFSVGTIVGANLTQVATATVNRLMTFKGATGNVGINTSSPSYKLDVNGNGRMTGSLNIVSDVTASPGTFFNGLTLYNYQTNTDPSTNPFGGKITFNHSFDGVTNSQSTRSAYIRSYETTLYGHTIGLSFGTCSAYNQQDNVMVIHGNGNVGIGYTSPSYKLHVNGNVVATNIAAPSDIRFKKNITKIQNPLQILESLNGYTYNRIDCTDSNQLHIGLIAQEVKEVLPEIVITGDDGYHAISYGNMAALFVEAIKELKKENQALQKRIEALEQKI